MMNRFEYEVTRERWYEEQDKDQKWIEEQEAITEANKLGIDVRVIEHLDQAFERVLGGKDE